MDFITFVGLALAIALGEVLARLLIGALAALQYHRRLKQQAQQAEEAGEGYADMLAMFRAAHAESDDDAG